MIKFNVKFDIDRARREIKADQKQINAGAARAIQRVAVTTRKAADQTMRQTLALKSSVVKNSLSIESPRGQRTLIRDVVATGKPIPIRDYNASETSKGVTFRVVRGAKRKVWMVKGRKGFIVQRLGGHVFAAMEPDPPGPKKARIKKAVGPSLTHRFNTKAVRNVMNRTSAERWPIEFDREMKYRAGRG